MHSVNTVGRSKYTLTIALLLLGLAAHAAPLPRPDHVLVVIEENRSYRQIMDEENRDSYIHALAKRGLLFSNSFGITHPSQPNYLALFSGSTQGVSNNACPLTFNSDSLASALLNAGFLVSAIRPPTVPQGSARLRVTFSALHEEQHVDRLLDALDKATRL